MRDVVIKIANWSITFSFYLLFFLVPLILTPINYELFEFNKMMLTYALTVIITSSWIIKAIAINKFELKRSPLDIPIVLFLASQIISTYFSIDRHVSIFGYYSRFNGGLLSTISYILLYYAFLSNIKPQNIKKYIYVILTSGILVSFYGILERLGIDKHIWVQDVQNRVFSTLGQPNWLAAFLAILIPITLGLGLNSNIKYQNPNDKNSKRFENLNLFRASNFEFWIYTIIGIIFYSTLIFTKSRSGFMSFWIANGIFWLILSIKYRLSILKIFLIFNLCLLAINFLFGFPFSQINTLTLDSLLKKPVIRKEEPVPIQGTVLDVGITESGNIRKIVWKGAVDITKAYPLFGSGVETFAFSYYKYRPVEHNMTSEWDFLYNKAHNEYLNYAATTGLIGLGSYLLFIGNFIVWNIIKLKNQISKINPPAGGQNSKVKFQNLDFGIDLNLWILELALFCGWLSILATNFLGFSVVIVQLLFYLLPAMIILLNSQEKTGPSVTPKTSSSQGHTETKLGKISLFMTLSVLIVCFYLLYILSKMWMADVAFSRGHNEVRNGNYLEGYKYLKLAIDLNPNEPLYFDEISLPGVELALAESNQKEEALTRTLLNEAIEASNRAIETSPNNIVFYKTRTRVFYALTALDEKYLLNAIEALQYGSLLSPTDPKIAYNLGLLYGKAGQIELAVTHLKKATVLKPDYKDAHFALALYYKELKQIDKAREELEFILTKISPNDEETKKQLEELP